MEDGWERRNPILNLDRGALVALMEPVADGRSVVETALLTGGLSNTLYRVLLSDGQSFVLRFTTRDPSASGREWALSQALVPLGVPMPEVVWAEPEPRGERPPYTIARWVEGEPLAKVLPLLADDRDQAYGCGRSIGEALVSLGQMTFETSGFLGADLTVVTPLGTVREGFLAHVGACLATPVAKQRLGEETARAVEAMVVEESVVLWAPLEERIQLVHSDFKVSNLMVKREGGVWSLSAVVDWEFAFAGPPLLDVGMMLRDEERLPPGFAAGFIDGFSSAGGVLPPRWRRAAELLDLVNLCGFLAMDDQVERPHLIADARRLVLDTLTRAPGGTEL